jgi:hypothetical protein
MRHTYGIGLVLVPWLISLGAGSAVVAQEQAPDMRKVKVRPVYRTTPMSMDPYAPQEQSGGAAPATKTETKTETETTNIFTERGYREVSDFFNIREANPQVGKGEWELELESKWFTQSGSHDTVGLGQSLKYGITDDFFVELEVEEPRLGFGADQGNGDANLILFERVVKETDSLPAIGLQEEMRVPSGDGSSGVDGTLLLAVTKTFAERFRAHVNGWITTANGEPGGESEDRRHFQWGFGPGFDYLIDEKTLALINYINKSSDDYGDHNNNILELGATRLLTKNDKYDTLIKFAVDIGLDGQEDTPHLGAKVLWEIGWK